MNCISVSFPFLFCHLYFTSCYISEREQQSIYISIYPSKPVYLFTGLYISEHVCISLPFMAPPSFPPPDPLNLYTAIRHSTLIPLLHHTHAPSLPISSLLNLTSLPSVPRHPYPLPFPHFFSFLIYVLHLLVP